MTPRGPKTNILSIVWKTGKIFFHCVEKNARFFHTVENPNP